MAGGQSGVHDGVVEVFPSSWVVASAGDESNFWTGGVPVDLHGREGRFGVSVGFVNSEHRCGAVAAYDGEGLTRHEFVEAVKQALGGSVGVDVAEDDGGTGLSGGG